MEIQLSPDTERMLRDRLASSQLESLDRVMEIAVNLVDLEQSQQKDHPEVIREEVLAGLAQLERGETVSFVPEHIMRLGRERMARKQ